MNQRMSNYRNAKPTQNDSGENELKHAREPSAALWLYG